MDPGGDLGSAAKGSAMGLEVAGSGLFQLPFFRSLLLTMCSFLACLSFPMVHGSKIYYVKHTLLTIHSLISPIGQYTSKLLAMAQYYSYQTAANQQDSKVKRLNTRIATLEQQLNDTKASKKKVETERESALEEKARTKVCTVQCLYDTCTLSWLVRATQFTVITVVSAMYMHAYDRSLHLNVQ